MSWHRRILAGVLAAGLWSVAAFGAGRPAPAALAPDAQRLAADWIATACRAQDGALTVRPHSQFVSGYFGNIAATGLASARMHLGVVLGWMAWYVEHAHDSGSGVDGVPDDVTIEPGGGLRSRHRPDSTDAYGATFMILALAAYDTGDPRIRAFVAAHRRELRTIALSIVATQQPDGLTWSRPQNPIEYAIDNEQVYRGLRDASTLVEKAFSDQTFARQLRARAALVAYGLRTTLWDPRTLTFRPYVDASGRGPAADLSRTYPDALAQVLAIVYGVVDPASPVAASLLARASVPLLSATTGDAVEFRYVVALAKDRMGTDAGGGLPFVDPPICADAGWFLQATSAPAAASPQAKG